MADHAHPRRDADMQEAFGASVDVTTADIGLYLVVAVPDHAEAVHRLVVGAGGQVAAHVSGSRVLAVLPYLGFERLRASPAIALVGPVSLDSERFAVFQRLAGVSDDAGSATENPIPS